MNSTTHHVGTADGIRLAVHHYAPNEKRNRGFRPVLLVHGLTANHYNLAFNEKYGMAQYLTRQGFHCYAPDLRGRKDSDKPTGGWNFDDYVRFDLPAILSFVRNHAGSSTTHYIGHSMGGVIYYAIAGAMRYSRQVQSAITLGSPPGMREPLTTNALARRVHQLMSLLRRIPPRRLNPFQSTVLSRVAKTLPVPVHYLPIVIGSLAGSRLLMVLKKHLPDDIVRLFVNPDNINPAVLSQAARRVVSALSYGEITQLIEWVVTDSWSSQDGAIDYEAGLSHITAPTLFVAGSDDRLTPRHQIERAHRLINTDDKNIVVAGSERFSTEYSHIDLIFGQAAPNELFPVYRDWLLNHDAEGAVES